MCNRKTLEEMLERQKKALDDARTQVAFLMGTIAIIETLLKELSEENTKVMEGDGHAL